MSFQRVGANGAAREAFRIPEARTSALDSVLESAPALSARPGWQAPSPLPPTDFGSWIEEDVVVSACPCGKADGCKVFKRTLRARTRVRRGNRQGPPFLAIKSAWGVTLKPIPGNRPEPGRLP